MFHRILSTRKRTALACLLAGVFLFGAARYAVTQIDENFVTIKSRSDIEFTFDNGNNPNISSFFEVFSPNSGQHPKPFFWLTETGQMFLRGPGTIDVSHKSGGPGRTALTLNGSSDNQDVGIFINRPRLFVWSNAGNTRGDLIIRNLQATGTKSAVIETATHGGRAIYAVESPEVWVEDYGSAKLVNGEARIPLDKLFLESVTVDDAHPLKVFVQLTDEANPVIIRKSDTFFVVKETRGGTSNASFDYRVVAKRIGHENTRFEQVPLGGN